MPGSATIGEFAIFPHGKTCFAYWISLREKLWILGITTVKGNDAFAVIKFFYLIINIFYIIAFISQKSTFFDRQKTMNISKNVKCNSGVSNICGGCQFIKRKTGNAVNKYMIFIPPIKFKLLFVCLIRSGMNSQFTIFVSFRLVVGRKFVGKERLGIA